MAHIERSAKQRRFASFAYAMWTVSLVLILFGLGALFGSKGPHGLFEYLYVLFFFAALVAFVVGGLSYLYSRDFESNESATSKDAPAHDDAA